MHGFLLTRSVACFGFDICVAGMKYIHKLNTKLPLLKKIANY